MLIESISIRVVIVSFKDKSTESIWDGKHTKKLPRNIQERAQMKLAILNSAKTIEELYFPPSNHFHTLSGDRKGEYSIDINKKYRICFKFKNENAYEVEINNHYEK